MEIKPIEDFISRWNELRKNEGPDVTKKMMIYGDNMYEKNVDQNYAVSGVKLN